MTPVDEAVERVRAFLDKNTDVADRMFIDELMEEGAELTLGDVRALLSALELGRPSKDAIAQIIDPEGWEKWNSLPANYRGPVVLPPLDAIDKAEKILALSAPTTNSGRLDAEERLHAEAETVCEAVARAIREADASFCYSAKLTRLVDDIATYTLTIMGGPPVEITAEDACEQYTAAVDIARSKHRAAAVVAALNASQAHVKHKAEGDCEPPPAPPTGEGGGS